MLEIQNTIKEIKTTLMGLLVVDWTWLRKESPRQRSIESSKIEMQ